MANILQPGISIEGFSLENGGIPDRTPTRFRNRARRTERGPAMQKSRTAQFARD